MEKNYSCRFKMLGSGEKPNVCFAKKDKSDIILPKGTLFIISQNTFGYVIDYTCSETTNMFSTIISISGTVEEEDITLLTAQMKKLGWEAI